MVRIFFSELCSLHSNVVEMGKFMILCKLSKCSIKIRTLRRLWSISKEQVTFFSHCNGLPRAVNEEFAHISEPDNELCILNTQARFRLALCGSSLCKQAALTSAKKSIKSVGILEVAIKGVRNPHYSVSNCKLSHLLKVGVKVLYMSCPLMRGICSLQSMMNGKEL